MTSLAQKRAQKLRRGVNLSHWYGQVYMAPGYCPEHYDSYMRQRDLEIIASLGFDHVRFPLALEQMMTNATGSPVRDDFVDRAEREIERLHALGLAVIVDLHPEDPYKRELATRQDAVDSFVAFWAALATRWNHLDPDCTLFEVLNEPGIGDASRWIQIQDAAVKAIRSATGAHTVVVCGDQYSQLPELLKLEAPPDDNLVYNFHLYDPAALTHQGAYWGNSWLQGTKGLVYPPEEANIDELKAATSDPKARAELVSYAQTDWGPDVYGRLLDGGVAWAASHGVPLICNEFGIYRKYVPRTSRLRWLRDITSAFSARQIGWTIWDYAGDFGVVVGEPGLREPDLEVISALGLAR